MLSSSAAPVSLGPQSPPALSCRTLVKRYGSLTAVDGLDLTVYRGECFGLLGPNGAGKTTTIEILEGLLEPDGGDVEVLGLRWATHAQSLRERIGVQLQETRLNEKLTVEEVIRLFRSFYPSGRAVDDVLAIVELTSKRTARVGKLSGGQKQRLAVACALVGNPELIFLDEPTTGLDPQSRRQLWDLLVDFRRQGGTILLTTHYMDEAEILCDRVAIVDAGRVIALGTPRELITSLGGSQIVECRFAGSAVLDASPLRALPGVHDVRGEADGRWLLATADVRATLGALLAWSESGGQSVETVSTHSATLEDVFVAKTGRHLRDG